MDKSSEEYLEHIKKLEPRSWLPEDIKIAIESFIASTIMVEENDSDYVPNEYIINLLETIKKHKEYNSLYLELIEILLPELRQTDIEESDENTKRPI